MNGLISLVSLSEFLLAVSKNKVKCCNHHSLQFTGTQAKFTSSGLVRAKNKIVVLTYWVVLYYTLS